MKRVRQEAFFPEFPDVWITGTDRNALSAEELAVLRQQARYCQAMVDADRETLEEIISPDKVFVHMSGKRQSRAEYLRDIESGRLTYFSIGIDHPVIHVKGDRASVTFTSVLDANAYGAAGVFRMKGTHSYEKRNGAWIAVNG